MAAGHRELGATTSRIQHSGDTEIGLRPHARSAGLRQDLEREGLTGQTRVRLHAVDVRAVVRQDLVHGGTHVVSTRGGCERADRGDDGEGKDKQGTHEHSCG